MKKNCIFALVLLFCCLTGLSAQVTDYAVSAIPATLLEHANTVKRAEQIQLVVKDPRTASLQYHGVFTILNAKGEDKLTFSKYSSTFQSLADASITVYDAAGKLLKTYTKKDMHNTSFGEGLVDDGLVTYFSVTAPNYPITIQLDYRVKYKGLLQYPVYEIQDEDQAVQQSSLQVIVPAGIGFRFKNVQTSIPVDKKSKDNLEYYNWAVKDLKAVSIEPGAGPDYQYLPQIVLAANKFNMNGYEGDMSTWGDFGKWVNSLNGKDNMLSETQIAFYQNLVKDAKTPLEKAAILYAYLQNNMRYVSIQLGIGGWKPFSAAFVSDKKYGDCKALSNFMQLSLAAVGVKSYPAVINAGDPYIPVTADFPMSWFNHVILCIPPVTGADTTWLECTSNTAKFGTLSNSTADHYAVLITPSGGQLVKTPAAKATDNCVNSFQHILIDDQGGAQLDSRLDGTGYFRSLFLEAVYQQQDRIKKDFITKGLGYKQTDSITVQEGLKDQTPYPFRTHLAYAQYQDFSSGNKLFIASRPLHLFFENIEEDTARKQDYYFSFPYQLRDTTQIVLTGSLVPESLPENISIQLPYGSYESSYHMDAATHTITIISRLCILKTSVKADQYDALYQFAKLAGNDLDEKIVLQKPE